MVLSSGDMSSQPLLVASYDGLATVWHPVNPDLLLAIKPFPLTTTIRLDIHLDVNSSSYHETLNVGTRAVRVCLAFTTLPSLQVLRCISDFTITAFGVSAIPLLLLLFQFKHTEGCIMVLLTMSRPLASCSLQASLSLSCFYVMYMHCSRILVRICNEYNA